MSKTVVITGSSSGIGKASALYFATRGWNVVATMRNPQERKTGLENQKNIELMHLDVLDATSARNAIAQVKKKYGRIDAFVNNAGYALMGAFEATTKEQVEKQYATNVFGLMEVVREIIPVFREQKGGTIINVASVGGRIGFPLYSVYNSTKWAVDGYSEALSYELEPFNIKVKVVEPGIIKTDFYTRSMAIAKKEGLTIYDEFSGRFVKNSDDFLNKHGSGPEVVAKVIYKAANDSSWRLRYPAGNDAHLMFFLRRVLPVGWFRGIIRMNMLKK